MNSPEVSSAAADLNRLAGIHDFSAKLRQPSMRGTVLEYVQWRRAIRAARSAGLVDPPLPHLGPLSINLDLSTACNYACTHCIDWDALNLTDKHESDQLFASLQDLANRGLQSVILIGGGEPTLYREFGRVVRFLKSELGLQVAVVSNGSRNDLITEVAGEFTSGDWVRLSLDAGSDELFQAMHRPKGKGIRLPQICQSAAAIKQAGPSVQLGFSFVITWQGAQRDDEKVIENLHEMYQAAELAKHSGFDYISFKPFLLRALEGAEVLEPEASEAGQLRIAERIQQQLEACLHLQDDQFKIVSSTNLKVLLADTWRQYTQQPRVCHMQALRQVLSPLGVFNCPAHRGVDKARIGDKNSWHPSGPAAEKTSQLIDQFDASKECQQVTCLYHPVNHLLEDLIAEPGDPSERLPVEPEHHDTFL
jgi:pyruvate-formate lyase-activating enzyme